MAAAQEAAIQARQQLVQHNLQAGQQLKVTHLCMRLTGDLPGHGQFICMLSQIWTA